jgi:hypothetical protein
VLISSFQQNFLKKLLFSGLEAWLKLYSTCPASARPCVQTPIPQKKKKKKNTDFKIWQKKKKKL